MPAEQIKHNDEINRGLTPRKIPSLNRVGLQTLIGKEIGRFMSVYTQTIVAPMITTLLFYAVFALAFGGITRTIGDIPYLTFLAPGLLMMTMVQNAFSNTSSSLVIAKVQGNIVDIIMPPLSATELYTGFIVGAIARGAVVGFAVWLIIFVVVGMDVHSIWYILAFGVLGCMMLAILGLLAGIWSQKFDHIAAVTNFVVTPMTFLSGTFYSVSQLPPFWDKLAHYNPFFYMIDGFRFGFIGHADGNVMIGLVLLIVVNIALSALALQMLRTGYKIKS
ncbi:MAG: ABC transporter permease [Alphaproteobacteria bacterium]|nr:ABC transporter permease [Alphaproteobacteria bacterium]NCQ88200.1 ABC transporter permease [Alphaproteobacteria bacterium]NCT05293.1 ABC transporter permease [Alphaproteobacteria bacterium]